MSRYTAPAVLGSLTVGFIALLLAAPSALAVEVAPGAVEKIDARTLHSKTFILPDGQYATRIALSPLHYQDGTGAWRDIDTALVPQVGGFVNTKNTLSSRFGLDGSVTVTRDGSSATWTPQALVLRDPAGAALAQTRAGVGTPTVSGSTLSLSNLFSGATDTYTVQRSLVKNDLVLQRALFSDRAGGASVLSEEGLVKLSPDLTVVVDGKPTTSAFTTTGPIEFLRADGTLAFRLSGVFAHDARFPAPANGGTPTYVNGALRGAFTSSGLQLAVEVPAAWLYASDRAYPVTIDPTWGWDDVEASVYIRQTEGNKNGDNFLKVGEEQGDWVFCCYYEDDYNRAFLRQDLSTIDNRITGISQVSADVYMYQWYSVSGTFNSYFVSSDSWSPATLTPSNQPGVGSQIGSVGISSGGWKTTTLDTNTVLGQIVENHVDRAGGDDQFSYSIRRSPETSNTDSAQWFYRTGDLGPEWLVTYTVDTVAPVTNYALSGTTGENGWYRSGVSVSLTCADSDSGCYRTQYRTNGGSWLSYAGTFSITPQGTTTLEYQSQDKVLNWNNVGSVPVSIDTVAPTSGISVSGTLGSNGWYTSTPTFTLSCSDATSGCALSQYRINGAGWTNYAGPVAVASSGVNTIEYTAKDAAGNWNNVQTTTVKVDTVLPVVNHVLSGTLGGNGWYRSVPTVTLTASDAHSGLASTEYRLNGGLWTAYSGAFNVPAEGINTLDYRATDNAGNVGSFTGNQVKVDLTPPSLSSALDGVLGSASWYTSQVGVTLTGSDAASGLSSMEYRVDGGAWTAYTTQFTLTTNGVRAVEFRGTDVAGNVASISTINPKIDTVLPTSVPTLLGSLGINGWYVSPVQLTLAGSDATSGVGSMQYRVNGGTWQTYTGAVGVTNQGSTFIEHYARDVAGNTEPTRSTTIKVDTVLPSTVRSLAGTLGSNGWYTTPVDVTLATSDATSGVLRTEYRVNGGAWQTYTQPFRVSNEGITVVEYRGLDNAGNVESAISVTLMIDTVLPTVTSVLDGLLGQLGWFLSQVDVTLNGQDASSGVDRIYYRIGTGGAWTQYTSPFTIAQDGTTTFSAYAVDAAGNAGQPVTWTVKIDRIVPITSRVLSGTLGLQDWYRSDVVATLSCSDTPSGCDDTFFRLGNAAWQTYSEPFTVVAEGANTLSTYSTDVAGNTEASVSGPVKIDKTPPVSTSLLSPLPNALGWIREVGTVTISATDALSGVQTISHRLDGGAWSDGSSFQVSAEGVHTVGHRATDVAGNVETERSLSVKLDMTPPTTTISLTPLPNVNGWNAGDVLVSLAATDALSGVDRIYARVDGGAWQQTSSLTVSGDLVHTVEFYATDLAGNAEAAKSANVRIDTTAPSVTGALSGLVGNAGWYLGAVDLTVTASDALSGVDTIRTAVDGGAESVYTGPVRISGDGAHSAAYRAIDRAGVSSATSTAALKIDATKPSSLAALTGVLGGGGWFLGDVSVALSASDATSGVSGISYALDGGPRLAYGAPFVVTGDGTHNVLHAATDVAGNVEVDRAASVKIDTTPPTLVATLLGNLGNQQWFVGPVNVRIDATDAQSGVATIEVRVDGGAWQPYNGPVAVTGSGQHAVEFRATDVAGNTASVGTTSFRVDVDLPVTTSSLSGVVGELSWFRSSVDLTLAATDATSGVSAIRYQIDGGAFRVYTAPVPIVADGEHTVRFFSEDVAGNAETARTISVRIDATVPSTVRTVTGLLGSLGWHVGPVNVALSASDGMSGVGRIMARVDGGAWQTYNGAIAVAADGLHAIDYQAFDVAGNPEPVQRLDLKLDQVAPITGVTLTGPFGSGGWFTGAARATLAATDATSGVAGIEWSLDQGAWNAYSGPVDILGDGAHTLRFRATDAAGNVEQVRSIALRIDSTLPSATLSIVGPLVQDLRAFVTSATQFVLTAVDGGSGAASIHYRLDGGAWRTYTGAFGVPLGDGTHTIEFYAMDAAGNAEPVRVQEVVLDDTAPTTLLSLNGPQLLTELLTYVHPTTRFLMSAADGSLGVGVAEIRYAIEPNLDRAYLPFSLEGADGARTIRYWAVDRLGNAGEEQTFAAFLDGTVPTTELVVGSPSFVSAEGERFVTSATALTVDATDPASGAGVATVEYKLDGGAWTALGDGFSLPVTGAPVAVTFRATDAVGNVAPEETLEFLVDDIAPEVGIVTPRPGSITAREWYFETDSDADGFADVLETTLGSDPYDADSIPTTASVQGPVMDAVRDAQRRAYAFEGSIVLFDLAAEDLGVPAAGVAQLKVLVNGEEVALIEEAPYTWAFDTSGLTLGVYAVEIVAIDELGNAAEVTMQVHVLPASLETAGRTVADTMGTAAVAVADGRKLL